MGSIRGTSSCDILIIGGGVIGLSIGIAILQSRHNSKVIIVEKESDLGLHASTRNSGVLHAGFYYSPDSLKAQFCKQGNIEMRKLAKEFNIPLKEVGKVVVTTNEKEDIRLQEILNRGQINNIDVELLHTSKLKAIEPLAVSHESFLWSPTTAVLSPKFVIESMRRKFENLGGKIHLNVEVKLAEKNEEIIDESLTYFARHYVNASGSNSNLIALNSGLRTDYAILPFLGIYNFTTYSELPLNRLVYPVPHSINPFLGVHFTIDYQNRIKIGPTAIPVVSPTKYSPFSSFSLSDAQQVRSSLKSIVKHGHHDLGEILKSEIPKYFRSSLLKEAAKLVPRTDEVKSWNKLLPGIRAQLVHLPSGQLEQDFVVKKHLNSTHVLNLVSPGLTSALPFGRYISNTIGS